MQHKTIKLAVIGLGTLLLVGGGLFILRPKQASNTIDTNIPVANNDSSTKMNKLMVADETELAQINNVMSMVINDGNSLIGTLEDVSGGTSSGTAYTLRKDGMLYHYAEATLPAPAEDMVYEGWLVKKMPTTTFFSTGVMKQSYGTYSLSYTSDRPSESYDFVVITLETKLDAIPETHIVEGEVR